jgi:hypothetical protein
MKLWSLVCFFVFVFVFLIVIVIIIIIIIFFCFSNGDCIVKKYYLYAANCHFYSLSFFPSSVLGLQLSLYNKRNTYGSYSA